MVARVGIRCLAVALLSGSLAEAEVGPVVTLTPTRGEYQAADPIVLEVLVANRSASTWWLIPELRPTLAGDQPYLGLSFEVRSPSGEVLVPSPAPLDKTPTPDLCFFHPQSPGEFFGMTVTLDDRAWGYAFTKRGRYGIKAIVVSSARRWLAGKEARRSVQPEARELLSDAVFDGRVQSPEVSVEVK